MSHFHHVAHRRFVLPLSVIAAGLASLSGVGIAGAQSTEQSSSTPQVAHNVREIPSAWTVLAAEHPCLANPWGAGCPHPPTQVTFPSDDQLQAAVAVRTSGSPAPSDQVAPRVGKAGEASIVVTAAGAPTASAAHHVANHPKAKAAQAVGACQLDIGYPQIIGIGGDDHARGTSDITCPSSYIETNVTDDLYRGGSFLASDFDEDFSPPLYALASALYNCHHDNAYVYTNQGLGYAELYNGTAVANSGSFSKNHTCPS